ncbi:YjdJ family protein [Bacillus thuringiensis]|uniref:YjdJ family protein n=1 Tax=Bacillus thuringiensis TaxID=1428 RepID=UPI003CF0C1FC
MTINQMFQLGGSFLLFISSTLISWYQGSNLIDYPDEWKYTAKFTNYFKGSVSNYKDIYQMDFFIYAAKFYPGWVIVMIISFIYMVSLSVYIIYKKNNKI